MQPATSPESHDVVVIGGGGSGLSVAGLLSSAGIGAVVLERSAVGASWRSRYERLHLHTHRLLSTYPGLRPARSRGAWIARDGMVEYLEAYVAHHGLDVRTGVEAGRVDRHGEIWRVASTAGEFIARHVVIATGYNHRPRRPDWPGARSFSGELIHGSEYRNYAPYVDRDVLVVGSGNTGAEIAQDLAEHGARRVRISIRKPPHIVPRNIGPLPITALTIAIWRLPSWLTDPMIALTQRLLIGNLSRHGLPAPAEGAFARHGRDADYIPLLDVGFVRELKRGRIEVVAAVARIDGARVHLSDGTVIEPQAMIAATGYERALEPLVGHLGVLGANGAPLPRRPAEVAPDAAGLHFVGFLNDFNGAIWAHSWEARRVARAIVRDERRRVAEAA
ncbi:MAG: NAD(P)/FAD-dependent oxidoreductase [Solirubrobacterales bacterium]|nr:NAD(P)/FAD-dependent oxidoreductase [Solirubrobacterales bacterium]